MGELVSDDTVKPWFLLLIFFALPLTIWLCLVLSGLDISDSGLSFLQVCVNTPESPVLLGRNLGIESCAIGSVHGTGGNWKDRVPGYSLVPVSFGLQLGPSEQKC